MTTFLPEKEGKDGMREKNDISSKDLNLGKRNHTQSRRVNFSCGKRNMSKCKDFGKLGVCLEKNR